jgi:hypothetical protein
MIRSFIFTLSFLSAVSAWADPFMSQGKTPFESLKDKFQDASPMKLSQLPSISDSDVKNWTCSSAVAYGTQRTDITSSGEVVVRAPTEYVVEPATFGTPEIPAIPAQGPYFPEVPGKPAKPATPEKTGLKDTLYIYKVDSATLPTPQQIRLNEDSRQYKLEETPELQTKARPEISGSDRQFQADFFYTSEITTYRLSKDGSAIVIKRMGRDLNSWAFAARQNSFQPGTYDLKTVPETDKNTSYSYCWKNN